MKTAKKTTATPSLSVNPKRTLSELVEQSGKPDCKEPTIQFGWNSDNTARKVTITLYYGSGEDFEFEKKDSLVEYTNLGELVLDTPLTDPETGEKIRLIPKEGWRNGKKVGEDRIVVRPAAEPKAKKAKDKVPF
jgi:hypothetical protein